MRLRRATSSRSSRLVALAHCRFDATAPAKNLDPAVVPPQIAPSRVATMRHYAKLLPATLTALLMLVALAGAAVAGDATSPVGDFYRPGCSLDDCPPGSRGLGNPTGNGVPKDDQRAFDYFSIRSSTRTRMSLRALRGRA